jgi:hypothetical protein
MVGISNDYGKLFRYIFLTITPLQTYSLTSNDEDDGAAYGNNSFFKNESSEINQLNVYDPADSYARIKQSKPRSGYGSAIEFH